MTVNEFLILSKVAPVEEVKEQIERLRKPYSVCKVKTPDTLNDITMGQLIALQSISDTVSLIYVPCEVLLGLGKENIHNADAEKVIGFSMWVVKEVERINSVFATTNTKPTPEEIKAGSESLNFGLFGLIDYYATRMGITNHEQVERVPWVRVYKCLDMDAKRMNYQRRLQKIIAEKR
jgi:hypothetical protein